MKTDSILTRSVFNSLLTVNIIAMVSATLGMVVDSVFTGQFLGRDAVAAAGLSIPPILLCNVIAGLISSGNSIVCNRYMGKAEIEEVNRTFSTSALAAILMCLPVPVLMFIFSRQIGEMICAGASPEVTALTADYLRWYAPGLAVMGLYMVLSGIMVLDNDRMRAVRALFVTLAADAVLDLMNVLIFHGGMAGMGLATSASVFCGLFVVLGHFRKKRNMIRYSLEFIDPGKLKDVFASGFSSVISQLCLCLKLLFLNLILKKIGGEDALAALSVANSAFVLVVSFSRALTNTVKSISSLFFGEENRRAIRDTFVISQKSILKFFGVITAVYLIFAPYIAGMFIDNFSDGALRTAAFLLRCFAADFMLAAASHPLEGILLAAGNLKLNYTIMLLRDLLFPLLFSLTGGSLFGMVGVGVGLALGGLASLVVCFVIPLIHNRQFPASAEDFLLLPRDFGPADGELFETTIHTREGVMEASEKVWEFCRENGSDDRTAMLFSLFVEEMAGNTFAHGFTAKREGYRSIDLRLIYSERERIIRFRDNGIPFDPVDWVRKNRPQDPASAIGIRMIVGLAKDVQYIPSLHLNNLLIRL